MRVENVKGAVWTVDELEFYRRRPQRLQERLTSNSSSSSSSAIINNNISGHQNNSSSNQLVTPTSMASAAANLMSMVGVNLVGNDDNGSSSSPGHGRESSMSPPPIHTSLGMLGQRLISSSGDSGHNQGHHLDENSISHDGHSRTPSPEARHEVEGHRTPDTMMATGESVGNGINQAGVGTNIEMAA